MLLLGEGLGTWRQLIPVGADRQEVGDRPGSADLLASPLFSDRLQDPGLSRISDQEAVVVEELLGEATVATLAILFQQRYDHVYS